MATHSAAERAALADALTDAGPTRSTLCDGWTTTQLAAHLVARERRPDAVAGILFPALSSWTDRVQARYARRDYTELVTAFRAGPPRGSALALPGLDARINLLEHFVHCEDVRRAGPGWAPRELPAARQEAFGVVLATMGRRLFRASPVSVTLRTPDGRSTQVIDRSPGAPRSGPLSRLTGQGSKGSKADPGDGVVLIGEPGELALYAYGRKDQARVHLEGPDDAVNVFRRLPLRF